MDRNTFINFDINDVSTPCFVVDTSLLKKNLALLVLKLSQESLAARQVA